MPLGRHLQRGAPIGAGLGFGHRPEVTDYITGLFTQNLRLFLAGKPLKNEVDMALGYTKKGTGPQ